MKYSPFKTFKNLSLVSTSRSLFIILGTTLFSLSIAQSAQAISKSFNFTTDTWDHGGSTSTGWTDGKSTGTSTKDGLSLTMTSTFFDGGAGHSGNLTDINSGTFKGFLMGNKNASDDIVSATNTLTGYQRWDFQFSESVNLEDVRITDLDSSSGLFIDAVAAEGFTSTPGSIGTGIATSFSTLGSDLTVSSINLLGGGSLNFVADIVGSDTDYGNAQTSTVANQAYISFADPVESFSLYLFNNLETSSSLEHGVGIGTETFEISVEQASASVPFEFSPGLGLLLSGGGLLGVKCLKRRQTIKLDLVEK